MAKIINSLIE